MRFVSLLSGEFTNMLVINPPERKLAKDTSVECKGLSSYYERAKGMSTRLVLGWTWSGP